MGNGVASHRLSQLYYKGSFGAMINEAKAFDYAVMSEKSGNADGTFFLSLFYSQGVGLAPLNILLLFKQLPLIQC